jgi:hypothetical protein
VIGIEGNKDQAAALALSVILLPISQSVHTHRTEPFEVLDFDVLGARPLFYVYTGVPAICC